MEDRFDVFIGLFKQYWFVVAVPCLIIYFQIFMCFLRMCFGKDISEGRLTELALSFHFFIFACCFLYYLLDFYHFI